MEYKGTNAAEPDWDIVSCSVLPRDSTGKWHMLPLMNHADAFHSSGRCGTGLQTGLKAELASNCPACQPSGWDYGDFWHHFLQQSKLSSRYSFNVEGVFSISDVKQGASVLMMLENFMGEEQFRQGVSSFLKAYEFANAATPDLWEELSVQILFGLFLMSSVWLTNIFVWWYRKPDLTWTLLGSWIHGRFKWVFPYWPTRQMEISWKLSSLVSCRIPTQKDPSRNHLTSIFFYWLVSLSLAVLIHAGLCFSYKWDVPIFYTTDNLPTVQNKWLYIENDSGISYHEFTCT